MICQPCKTAGFFNAELTRYEHLPMAQGELAEAAAASHAKCRGGTWCDCHHVVGQVLNKQARPS